MVRSALGLIVKMMCRHSWKLHASQSLKSSHGCLSVILSTHSKIVRLGCQRERRPGRRVTSTALRSLMLRTNAFIGGSGLNQINQQYQIGNLGYWVRTSCTGQGVATRAVRLLARFGFEELGLGRIEIVAAVGNTASQRVAEKAGAHREGVLRRRLFLHDEYHDAVMYSLITEDLK